MVTTTPISIRPVFPPNGYAQFVRHTWNLLLRVEKIDRKIKQHIRLLNPDESRDELLYARVLRREAKLAQIKLILLLVGLKMEENIPSEDEDLNP
jgi:hypothetical protein